MSFCRFALRLSAVMALRGKTLAGDNVHNSRIGVIDFAADGSLSVNDDKVFLDVFSDDSTADDVHIRDMHQNGVLALNFESGVTSTMVESDPETGAGTIVGVGIPATDDAYETTLDLLDSQIQTELTNPDNDWAEIWRKLHNKVIKIERKRVASSDDGIRRAARQLRITVEAKADPVKGEVLKPTSPFMQFKEMVDQHVPEHSQTVDVFLGENADFTIGTVRAAFGNTASEARSLAYAENGLNFPHRSI